MRYFFSEHWQREQRLLFAAAGGEGPRNQPEQAEMQQGHEANEEFDDDPNALAEEGMDMLVQQTLDLLHEKWRDTVNMIGKQIDDLQFLIKQEESQGKGNMRDMANAVGRASKLNKKFFSTVGAYFGTQAAMAGRLAQDSLANIYKMKTQVAALQRRYNAERLKQPELHDAQNLVNSSLAKGLDPREVAAGNRGMGRAFNASYGPSSGMEGLQDAPRPSREELLEKAGAQFMEDLSEADAKVFEGLLPKLGEMTPEDVRTLQGFYKLVGTKGSVDEALQSLAPIEKKKMQEILNGAKMTESEQKLFNQFMQQFGSQIFPENIESGGQPYTLKDEPDPARKAYILETIAKMNSGNLSAEAMEVCVGQLMMRGVDTSSDYLNMPVNEIPMIGDSFMRACMCLAGLAKILGGTFKEVRGKIEGKKKEGGAEEPSIDKMTAEQLQAKIDVNKARIDKIPKEKEEATKELAKDKEALQKLEDADPKEPEKIEAAKKKVAETEARLKALDEELKKLETEQTALQIALEKAKQNEAKDAKPELTEEKVRERLQDFPSKILGKKAENDALINAAKEFADAARIDIKNDKCTITLDAEKLAAACGLKKEDVIKDLIEEGCSQDKDAPNLLKKEEMTAEELNAFLGDEK